MKVIANFFFILKTADDEQQTQINTNTTVNYGAMEHVPNNPFAYAASTLAAEPVQPAATDTYMHGTTEDRTY